VEFDESGKVIGVTPEGETARCQKVICDPSYVPNKKQKSRSFLYQMLNLLRHALMLPGASEAVTLGESGGESFWEEGDDFRVDVLRFHTCLTDILGFLEKLEWWFEQDIDNEEEGEGGSEEGFDGLERQHWTMRRCFGTKIRGSNEMIHHHFHQGFHPTDEMRMDDLEWWRRRN
nr:guanosine nucleotide diphosphate dissociation inhibitor 2 [Tanacetum cinerariifolium]